MQVTDNAALGRYEAEVPGALAFVDYRLKPGRIVFTHLEVPEGRRGLRRWSLARLR
jgi:hypothetical protein